MVIICVLSIESQDRQTLSKADSSLGIKDALTDGSTDLLSRQFKKLDPFLNKNTPWKRK